MPQHDLVLGLDVGTTNIKCLALDDAGTIVAQGSEPTRRSHPRPDWTDRARTHLGGSLSSHSGRGISIEIRAAIGGIVVSSFGESVMPIDSRGQPLDVFAPLTTSTSGIRCGELKGCPVRQRFGCLHSDWIRSQSGTDCRRDPADRMHAFGGCGGGIGRAIDTLVGASAWVRPGRLGTPALRRVLIFFLSQDHGRERSSCTYCAGREWVPEDINERLPEVKPSLASALRTRGDPLL
jgi:hypothetical protein